ncbi:PIG-L family deacetylase [Streptomyces sp. H10-C2]|uniref:PIG-L family deacetylase n=1 Tax=unclassified Streptomyces TaxID=2593676 RepID=UPI0024BBA87A|nr:MULTISPECIES: PIG-L family deacetylase [unclassified Streptomyces]MDJ0340662.1 PIG-L family deacetylase [Streptomyces sp. PH10-H1]MDJ0370310.1 PIG-L family deacetylase [Streptomyces sp. H10-C2]
MSTTAAAVGCTSTPSAGAPVTSADPNAVQAYRPGAGPLLFQVLAHPDDDLYFMNPDTLHALQAGVPVVSVYVTAGESVGVNHAPHTPKPKPDRQAYSSSRHQGLRQAYATMLGLDKFTPWHHSALSLTGGLTVELDQLSNGDRKADLVFVNLSMGEGSPHMLGLPHLWAVPGITLDTVVATGSPVRASTKVSHRTLVDSLAALLERYRPTLVQTLDPDPDIQVHDAAHHQDSDQVGYSDHRDHTPAALFAWKALAQWVDDSAKADGKVPRFAATSYRGYYNQRWPRNLPQSVVRQKNEYLLPYGGDPGWDCGNTSGCGDYGVGQNTPLTNPKGWVRSTHYRYPGARPATFAGADGRLEAFSVLGTRAVRWQESGPGSARWGDPLDLGGGPLAPALAAVKDSTGRRLLFALRFSSLEGQGGHNAREIVLLEQSAPDGPYRAWTGMGNPEHDEDRGRRIGCPVAIATPDGRIHLFARSAARGVWTRVREAGGTWGDWLDLGGDEVQDGLSVVLDGQARVHVLAAGRDTVHHWTQPAPGQPMSFQALTGMPQPGEPPSAALAPDGTIAVAYRRPVSGELVLRTVDGTMSRDSALNPGQLHGYGGYADVTVGAAPAPAGGGGGGLLLLSKELDGTVKLLDTAHPAQQLKRPPFALPVGTPALLHGADGRAYVVGLDFAATPWVWRPETHSPA